MTTRKPYPLRYDDRLETIMKARTRDAGARAAMWVQLVDVLAQDRGNYPPELRESAFRWLDKWRQDVPESRRMGAAVTIAGRPVSDALLDFFARDTAPVAHPVLTRCPARASWLDFLASWPASSRAILAERTDLPEDVARGLASLDPQTLALPPVASQPEPPVIRYDPGLTGPIETIAPAYADTVAEPIEADVFDLPVDAIIPEPIAEIVPPTRIEAAPPVTAEVSQPAVPAVAPINELLARIDRYRKDNPQSAQVARGAAGPAKAFVFETDRNGAINWLDGAPRGALIGLSLADMALPGECGVDGQAAGAFRKRARFDHARLRVNGHGPAAGDWLISGDPVFDPEGGRFLGYQGQARRLTADAPEGLATPLIGGAMRPESVRQLVHELRTPLNAIRGFAEMIEGQFLGPVADGYRQRADAIIRDSQRLLRVFEDLDSAARLESGDFPIAEGARVDLVGLVRASFEQASPMATERKISLRVSLPDGDMVAGLDEGSSTQLLSGFVELLAGVARESDVIQISLDQQAMAAHLVAVPVLESGLAAGWDWSATVAEGPGQPSDILPLGLGYKFRLLSRLAQRVGGSLSGTANRLTLILPMATSRGEQTQRG